GAEFKRLGKSYVGKVYPPTGPEDEQAHCFGGAKGMHVWAADVVAFLGDVMRQREGGLISRSAVARCSPTSKPVRPTSPQGTPPETRCSSCTCTGRCGHTPARS